MSIFYALALGLIPFIAKRIITGDVGSSAYALVRAGAVAVGAAVSAGAGFAAGAGAGAGASGAGAGSGGGGSGQLLGTVLQAVIRARCLLPCRRHSPAWHRQFAPA